MAVKAETCDSVSVSVSDGPTECGDTGECGKVSESGHGDVESAV